VIGAHGVGEQLGVYESAVSNHNTDKVRTLFIVGWHPVSS
jgi:hypothetical protein